jgi:hypothetical protein
MFDRRGFLKSGTGAWLLAGLVPVAWFSGSGRASASDVDPYSRAHFEGLVGDWVHVDTGSWQSMQVVAVEDGPADARVEQFSVVLSGSTSFEPGTYEVATPGGDVVELYLQPSADEGDARAHFGQIRQLASC